MLLNCITFVYMNILGATKAKNNPVRNIIKEKIYIYMLNFLNLLHNLAAIGSIGQGAFLLTHNI